MEKATFEILTGAAGAALIFLFSYLFTTLKTYYDAKKEA